MKFKHASGEIWNGDCLELMRNIPDGSVDMILCDLPYGTTACKWDTIIPFGPLWEQYWRVTKPNAAIVLTASQPFTTALIYSQMDYFKYCWVWNKVNRFTGALHANKRPMKAHEDVCIFYKKQPVYNKQYIMKPKISGGRGKTDFGEYVSGGPKRLEASRTGSNGEDVYHNPISIINIKADVKPEMGLHPTQKPIALFEYLIKTYTNPSELILDNTSGSGTTAVAAHRTGRRSICIERDLGYYLGSCGRIWKEQQ